MRSSDATAPTRFGNHHIMITGKNNKFIVLTLATAVILIVTVGLLLNDRNAGRYSVTNGKDLDALIETAIQTTNPQICKALYVPWSIDGITTSSSQELCFQEYILAHPSVDVCPQSDESCVTDYAIAANKPIACLSLTQPSDILDCVTRIAGQYDDLATCDALNSTDAIDYCRLHYKDYTAGE